MYNVSRETLERLEAYTDLLITWNRRINLVGAKDRREIWQRHVVDCLQLGEMLPDGAQQLADLGSGAGLPGLILAIARPDLSVICVESDRRKAAFLSQVVRTLSIDAEVCTARIETLAPIRAPVVTARALAPLRQLLGYVERHMHPTGCAVLMKGETWKEELENARATWHFSCEAASSRTNPNAVILKIGGLKRA